MFSVFFCERVLTKWFLYVIILIEFIKGVLQNEIVKRRLLGVDERITKRKC